MIWCKQELSAPQIRTVRCNHGPNLRTSVLKLGTVKDLVCDRDFSGDGRQCATTLVASVRKGVVRPTMTCFRMPVLSPATASTCTSAFRQERCPFESDTGSF